VVLISVKREKGKKRNKRGESLRASCPIFSLISKIIESDIAGTGNKVLVVIKLNGELA